MRSDEFLVGEAGLLNDYDNTLKFTSERKVLGVNAYLLLFYFDVFVPLLATSRGMRWGVYVRSLSGQVRIHVFMVLKCCRITSL